MKRAGKPVPAMDDKPEVYPRLTLALMCYSDLTFGNAQLSWLGVNEWGRAIGLDREDAEELWEVVRQAQLTVADWIKKDANRTAKR